MKARKKLYTLSIRYFLLYVLLTISTGLTLFFVENGLNIQVKSFESIVEILSPHLIAMGLTLFVVAHFLLFSGRFKQIFSLKVFLLVSLFIVLDQSMYMFMAWGISYLTFFKYLSITLYTLGMFGIVSMVWLSL